MRKFLLILSVVFVFPGKAFSQSDYDLNVEVYPKLASSCSTPLNEAHCADAKERKAYIEALKEAGISKEDIFFKVAKKFSLNAILDKELKAGIEAKIVAGLSTDRPQLVVENESFHFGELSRKQDKVSHIFKIYNKGKSDLIITNLYSACACTSASLKNGKDKSPFFNTNGADKGWQSVIKPGKSAEVGVVLELTHKNVKAGPLERKTFILSNDPLYPSTSVTISAQIKD